jgi:hypothetical protein
MSNHCPPPSSLVAEKPLQISPALATTLGLEEATMLAVFSDLLHYGEPIAHNGLQWLEVKEQTIERTMPFWNDLDVQRICKSLSDKGVIILGSAPYASCRVIQFALNEQAAQPLTAPRQKLATPNSRAHNQVAQGANRISPQWQPSDDVMRRIAQHNIPEQYVRDRIAEFVTYWSERAEAHHSWGSKFIKQVLHHWQEHQTQQSRQQRVSREREQERFIQADTEGPIAAGWRPSPDALEILLKHAAIEAHFVEEAIPEFIIYWQEKGVITNTWNSKFIQHVRRQWARYSSTVEHNSEAKLLAENWRPSEDAIDVLRLANIDLDFARQQQPDFVLYWRDRKEIHNAWNSKFVQHCKYHWARRHQMATQTAQASGANPSGNTRERSLSDDLTDRSWAT